MQQILPRLRHCLTALTSVMVSVLALSKAYASVYCPGGAASCGGLNATPFGGMSTRTSVVSIVLVIITFILNIIVIIAILAIIIAGVYLIVSGGDEGQKDKAKKIILYAVIGIIVIVMARVIVLIAENLF